jgi:hypothetical protein
LGFDLHMRQCCNGERLHDSTFDVSHQQIT